VAGTADLSTVVTQYGCRGQNAQVELVQRRLPVHQDSSSG
jgi:hypothetical protein